MSLRIALVAPIASPVGPGSTSSIEALVWLLGEKLVRRGHQVTLFASGDSITSAELCSVYPLGYWDDPELWTNWQLHEMLNAAAAFERADRFDVIHSHAYHYALPFSRLGSTALATTYHINPDPDVLRAVQRYPEVRVVAVSRYHARKFKDVLDVRVIPNGIDVKRFPFGARRGEYLLFLGHLIPKKGPLEAIEIARRAGMRLVMVGKGGEYFESVVRPEIDGHQIVYLGPVSVRERNALLSEAAALVFSSPTAEPFGLVLIEAMACGTPVAALERCAVAEIVDRGVTGDYAHSVGELVERLPAILALDRTGVRRRALERFDYPRLIDRHEELYRELVGAAGLPKAVRRPTRVPVVASREA